MIKRGGAIAVAALLLGTFGLFFIPGSTVAATTTTLGDVTLSGGYQAGHFDEVFDLTAGDITLSFTYDGNGLVDDAGAHAWAELGVRSASWNQDFNPYGTYTVCTYDDVTVDLLAGQTIDVGSVTAHVEDGKVLVTFETDGRWWLTETHVAVAASLDGIPQTKNGNPIPGQFADGQSHDPMVRSYTYEIDVPKGCGTIYIAAHASVAHVVCGVIDQRESAWGAGKSFPGNNWATYFTLIPDCVTITGAGVWLATDYEYVANTFDPDPVGAPTLDLDDKLILQKRGGYGEGAYDLPGVPPAPGNNHRFWWDRDGVDPWQNPATANTDGIYHIVITLHATSDTTGTAYMTINGLAQGFETDGNWNTIELTPAGMTWTADMHHLQVFYGLYGYGATHSVTFSDIEVTQ